MWYVDSLDIVLGLVGGFVGLIWGTLEIIFGGYESFRLQNSLIGAVYPTSPQGRSDFDDNSSDKSGGDEEVPKSEKEAKRIMLSTVAERGKYWYNYSEYLLI